MNLTTHIPRRLRALLQAASVVRRLAITTPATLLMAIAILGGALLAPAPAAHADPPYAYSPDLVCVTGYIDRSITFYENWTWYNRMYILVGNVGNVSTGTKSVDITYHYLSFNGIREDYVTTPPLSKGEYRWVPARVTTTPVPTQPSVFVDKYNRIPEYHSGSNYCTFGG